MRTVRLADRYRRRSRLRGCRSSRRRPAGSCRGWSRRLCRPGLRRLRQRLRVLVGDDDVAAFQRAGVVGVLERVGPALARPAARAAGSDLLAIAECVRQRRVKLAAGRHRLLHVLAGIAVGVERGFGRRAQRAGRRARRRRTGSARSSRRSGNNSRRRCARRRCDKCRPARRRRSGLRIVPPPNSASKKPCGPALRWRRRCIARRNCFAPIARSARGAARPGRRCRS